MGLSFTHDKTMKIIFGKIDFINLLPLHVYLKKYPLPNGIKKAMEYKKGMPSKLNKELHYRRVGAAVISSIASDQKGYKRLDIGICAHKNVQSVLVQKGVSDEKDPASATSNMLALVLKQHGKVVIGDKALKLYLQSPNEFIDLCTAWYDKYNLPFVFARFCCVSNINFFKKIFLPFLRTKVFIPRYILDFYANSRQISPQYIKAYLNLIYYKISFKEKKALKLFFHSARKYLKRREE